MFYHQVSYLINVSKQRRKEYTDAMDYIINTGVNGVTQV